MKSAQNQLLCSEICQKIFVKLAFLTIVFWGNLSGIYREIPVKLAVFSANLSLKIP